MTLFIRAVTQRAIRLCKAVRQRAPRPHSDAGMSTAEYAVGIIAAVAFAGILLKVLTSPQVQKALGAIVEKALSA